jgi:hypothetical protein
MLGMAGSELSLLWSFQESADIEIDGVKESILSGEAEV